MGVASFLLDEAVLLKDVSNSSSMADSSSLELADRKLSSKPVMEYSYSSSSSLLSESSSSTSVMISLRGVAPVGRERRIPVGTVPILMGVLGGKRLSKNSGDSMGPKVTLLRVLLLGGSSSVLVVLSSKDLESKELLRDLFRAPGEGEEVKDSFISWMEAREDFLDR